MPKRSFQFMHGSRRRFTLPPTPARLLGDLTEEAHAHLAMRTDELVARGMSPQDAEREAVRRFGDTNEFFAYAERRATRQARWNDVSEWFTAWTQDLRFALRQFRKAPAFTAIAVITLALGIGANTAIFSVVHHLLLAPLPYPNGDRIVMLREADENGPAIAMNAASVPAWPVWQVRARSFDAFAASAEGIYHVQESAEQDSVPGATITPDFLKVLGVQPELGRAFAADEGRAGTPLVAMISYGLWRRGYGGRSDVLGTDVHVNGRPYKIVGVAPRGMVVPMSREAMPVVWLPTQTDAMRGFFDAFARLRPGITPEAATAELQRIERTVPNAAPLFGPRTRSRAMRAQDFIDARETRTIEVLFVAVGALLLIACANVANLLLARAWTRRREFAIRAGLGAGRGRLARLVLTESVTLALAGGLAGALVAWGGLRIIIGMRPASLDNLADVQLEPAVLMCSAVISVLTGVLFGAAPALFASAKSIADSLRTETRGSAGSPSSRRLRSGLIVFEIAVSLVLLVGAGLLVRSFVALQRSPLGFEPHGLVSLQLNFPRALSREARAPLRDAILERIRAVPGVSAATTGMLPGLGFTALGDLEVETNGGERPAGLSAHTTSFIGDTYLAVTGAIVVAGRLPDSTEIEPVGGGLSAVAEIAVSRSLARRLWPDGNAIGSRLRARNDAWSTVVGVIEDIHMPGPTDPMRASVVYSRPLSRLPETSILVRAPQSSDIIPTLRGAIADVNAGVIVRKATTGDAYLRDALAPARFAMTLLTVFAVVALLLSAIGLYGVISYSVSQRTREIGLRVALGAQPTAVATLVVGDGLRLAAVGVVAGVAIAAACTRALESMLFGVSSADPATFAGTALLVAVFALLASYVPARRALRIDPSEALRAD